MVLRGEIDYQGSEQLSLQPVDQHSAKPRPQTGFPLITLCSFERQRAVGWTNSGKLRPAKSGHGTLLPRVGILPLYQVAPDPAWSEPTSLPSTKHAGCPGIQNAEIRGLRDPGAPGSQFPDTLSTKHGTYRSGPNQFWTLRPTRTSKRFPFPGRGRAPPGHETVGQMWGSLVCSKPQKQGVFWPPPSNLGGQAVGKSQKNSQPVDSPLTG